jgi:hypothetical protein
MVAFMITGWFVNPPYPFPLENNLAVVDFVYLQRDAAQYVESYHPSARIASVWPFTDAVKNPDFGYVQRRLNTTQIQGLTREDFAKLDLANIDALVVFTRSGTPPRVMLDIEPVRALLRRFANIYPEASAEEIRSLGFQSEARWVRGVQWIEVYTRQPQAR